MVNSLRFQHAKAVTALDGLGPFDELAQAFALMNESAAMARVMRKRAKERLLALQRSGASWGEITSRSGLDEPTLTRLARSRDEPPGTDAAARA